MWTTNFGFAAIVDMREGISFFVDREHPSYGDTEGAPMASFVYVIHCEYQDPADPLSVPAPMSPQQVPEALHRFPAELRTYFQDPAATILVKSLKDDAIAIQVTVLTTLSEALADAAFVRSIRNCSLAAPSTEHRTHA